MIKLDFILISLIVFMIINGFLFGFFRSFRILISLIISVFLSFLTIIMFKEHLLASSLFNSISSIIFKVLRTFTDTSIDGANNILIFAVVFLFTYVIFYYIVSLFGPKKLKILSMELDNKSRLYGTIWGLFDGAFISLSLYFIISNLYNIESGFLVNLLRNLFSLLGV